MSSSGSTFCAVVERENVGDQHARKQSSHRRDREGVPASRSACTIHQHMPDPLLFGVSGAPSCCLCVDAITRSSPKQSMQGLQDFHIPPCSNAAGNLDTQGLATQGFTTEGRVTTIYIDARTDDGTPTTGGGYIVLLWRLDIVLCRDCVAESCYRL